jgi:CRP/FNR family transcriptional regulator
MILTLGCFSFSRHSAIRRDRKMLAHAEIRFEPLPFPSVVRSPERRVPNSLLEDGKIRHLTAHEHAFFEGDKESHIYRIEAGLMRLYRLLADGRRQIIAFRSAGDVIGIGSHGKQFCSAEAVTPVTLRSLPLSVAHRRIREEPLFQAEYLNLLTNELAETRQQLAMLNKRSASERVAGFISDHCRRSRYTDRVELQVSRNDIADLLGLTIETVSRTLTRLRNQHVIETPHAQSIVITDLDRLEALADGNCDCSNSGAKSAKAGR